MMPDLRVTMEVSPDAMADEVWAHAETIRVGDFTVIHTHTKMTALYFTNKVTTGNRALRGLQDFMLGSWMQLY